MHSLFQNSNYQIIAKIFKLAYPRKTVGLRLTEKLRVSTISILGLVFFII